VKKNKNRHKQAVCSEFKKSALTIKKEEDKEEDNAEEAVEDLSKFLRKISTIIFIYKLFQNFL